MIARVLLVAAALAVLVLCAGWLRAVGDETEAGRLVGAAPQQVPAADVERALRLLRRAERLQPDAGPRQTRATILIARGRPAEAAALLRDVVRIEPRNGVAYAFLSQALRPSDPAAAAAAKRRADELLPRPTTER